MEDGNVTLNIVHILILLLAVVPPRPFTGGWEAGVQWTREQIYDLKVGNVGCSNPNIVP